MRIRAIELGEPSPDAEPSPPPLPSADPRAVGRIRMVEESVQDREPESGGTD